MADDEQVFLDQGGVLVTDKRIVTAQGTYAMAGVVSFRQEAQLADKTGPWALVVLGVILALVSIAGGIATEGWTGLGFGVCVGGALAVIGWFWKAMQANSFSVVLRNAGGEVKAVESNDDVFIGMVGAAVTKAMVSRS